MRAHLVQNSTRFVKAPPNSSRSEYYAICESSAELIRESEKWAELVAGLGRK
jgi:hypothetical protein